MWSIPPQSKEMGTIAAKFLGPMHPEIKFAWLANWVRGNLYSLTALWSYIGGGGVSGQNFCNTNADV